MTDPDNSHSSVTSTSQKQLHLLDPATQLPIITPDSCLTEKPWWITSLQNWQRNGIVLLLCSSGVVGAPIAIEKLQPVNTSQPIQQIVTRTDYELLKVGMTISDAQASLGSAIEERRDEILVTYKWTNSDGSEIRATFKSDYLVSKQQVRLK